MSSNNSEFIKDYKRLLSLLFSYYRSLNVVSSDLEDLIQEAAIKIYKNYNNYNPTLASFNNWALAIAKNVYIDWLRSKKKNYEALYDFENSYNQDHNKSYEIVEQKDQINQILKCLSSEERYLLELKIFGNLKFSEISDLTNINESTLRVKFFRALQKLKQRIINLDSDND